MIQILLFTLLTIPIIGFGLSIAKGQNFLIRFSEIILPVLFLINLFGLYHQSTYSKFSEELWPFYLDNLVVLFLFLLGVLWLAFSLYFQRFCEIIHLVKSYQYKIFLNSAVIFLVLIFTSKDITFTLASYLCLIAAIQVFVMRNLRRDEVVFLRIFGFLLYFEVFFFFLAVVATKKFIGDYSFVHGGLIGDDFSGQKLILLLALYSFALFSSAFSFYWLIFKRSNLEPILTYLLFFFAHGFAAICLFVKILHTIFGFKNLLFIATSDAILIIEAILLFSVLTGSILLIFAKGIKSSFLCLFSQQFFTTIFAIFIFGIFDSSKIHLPLLSFLLSMSLIFFALSNITIYLSKSKSASMSGLFYKLTISSILMIFALLNMAGLAPAVGAIENFFLIKIIWQKHLTLPAIIFAINFLALLIFVAKSSYYFLSRNQEEVIDEEKLIIAHNIDFDSRLILTSLSLLLLMVFGAFMLNIL